MQVLSLLALAAVATAANVEFNTQHIKYVTASSACVLQPGYALYGSAVQTADPVTPLAAALGVLIEPLSVDPADGSGCQMTTAAVANFGLGCASGWNASTAKFPTGNVAAGAMTAVAADFTNLVNFEAKVWDSTAVAPIFTCTLPSCTYTCTGNGTNGAGCASTSGTLSNGTAPNGTAICATGYWTATSTVCSSNGTNINVVCTQTLADITSYDAYLAAVNGTGTSYSRFTGGRCTCQTGTDVRCPTNQANGTQPFCTGCLVPTNPACTSRRQVNVGVVGVTCPAALTLAQAEACFKSASCAGIINSGQTCIYSIVGNANPLTAPCPNCDGSKKGLLGLLGLLGLIPLLLCSLLLCCLLLACRRNKKGAPQHIGTFEQPAVCDVPVPVTQQFVTAHTTTHVGAPHPHAVGPTVF